VYDYYEEEVMCVELDYKNPAIIPPLQSRVALAETFQNRQNSAVSLAPRHISLYIISQKRRFNINSCEDSLIRIDN